jgi:hypothetical protein
MRRSPSTSVNETAVLPKKLPPLVTPTFSGGRPSRNILSQEPFLTLFSPTSVWFSGAWKSMTGPGAPKSADSAVTMASFFSTAWSW